MKFLSILVCLLLTSRILADTRPVFVLALSNAESYDRSLPKLRFAQDDVQRMQKALERMTGATAERTVILQEADRLQLRKAFDILREQLRSTTDAKFIFYYTGHADARGLHLADGLLPRDELNARLASLPASSRVVFFDSCYSGALAAKGVRAAGDFIIPRAEYDEPSGSVFLAATSETDVAFELDELHGSLFTHHVVAGLYGAADSNQDGLVTIDELYHYVYQQMKTASQQLPRGQDQKPEFSMRLQGRGALVLASLEKTTVPVTIAADVRGRLTLATDGGLQVFRFSKNLEQPIQVRLVPGDYRVTLEQDEQIGRGSLQVRSSGTQLHRSQLIFEKPQQLALVAKGGRSRARLAVNLGLASSTYARPGPRLEVEGTSRGALIESVEVRGIVQGGVQQNELDYRQQTGSSTTAGLLLGLRTSFWPAWAWDGQEFRLMLAAGADDVKQAWDPAENQRRFKRVIPKVAYGLGTTLMQASGISYGLHFRREFPFATDADSGDVLALGASIWTLSMEW